MVYVCGICNLQIRFKFSEAINFETYLLHINVKNLFSLNFGATAIHALHEINITYIFIHRNKHLVIKKNVRANSVW